MLGRKAELPEELKGLNLSPSEILAKLNEKSDLEKKLKDQETELNNAKTSLETTKGSVATLQTKLAEMEQSRQASSQGNGDPNQLTSFLDDENKAFAERVAPLAATAFRAAATAAKMSAKNSLHGKTIQAATGTIRLASLWDRWEGEISKAAESIPAIQLQHEGTWLNLFDYVKGQHMNDLIGKPSEFIEPVQQYTNTSVNRQEGPVDKLTDEEERQAKKMKLDPQKFLEAKKKMRFVGAV